MGPGRNDLIVGQLPARLIGRSLIGWRLEHISSEVGTLSVRSDPVPTTRTEISVAKANAPPCRLRGREHDSQASRNSASWAKPAADGANGKFSFACSADHRHSIRFVKVNRRNYRAKTGQRDFSTDVLRTCEM